MIWVFWVPAAVKVSHLELSYFALLALGVASFCLASVISDPLSRVRSVLHGTLALLLIAVTEQLGRLCASRPLWVVAGSVVLAALCLQRAFGVTAFRETPFRPLAPILGAHSLGQSRRFEREKLARRGVARNGAAVRREAP